MKKVVESLEYETRDVFTGRRFNGNPLAVVFGADGIGDERMLQLTREFDYSETGFATRRCRSWPARC
ncbi:MAG: PhzF family phenazine biosynthesis protein [Wenzhouxiangellaceae bacterium]|nr:PhzF family phenazine biosynthesis protein [Wenzhouxiangellaceae bacterium]